MTVLGSSGSYASTDNPCTGYLVRSPGASVVLDCGPGTLGPLQAALDLSEVSAIVITHCHPDHWLELPVLRNVLTFFQPRDVMPVFATAETMRMESEVSTSVEEHRDPFSWQVINKSSTITIGDQAWSFARTDHPVETLAVRVDAAERSFAYTSDTGPDWEFSELGEGIDLIFSDASHLAESEGMGIPHLSAREAGVRARDINAGRLVVTHLVPGSDREAHRAEAGAAYGGPVDVALPGLTFDV